MEEGQIVYSKRREREHAVKDFVAKGSYSVIIVVVALIALRPLMVRQLLNRADAYSAFGLYEESKRQCDKALLLDSDNSQVWYNLAHIHKTQEHLDLALGAYQKATETDPGNVPAQFELGMMYVQDGRHQQAIPHFDQVRRCSSDKTYRPAKGDFPYHKSSLDMLLGCYEKVGDTDKAEFTREEMRVFYPHHAPSEGEATESN
ncbi:MAG: tetratricopeptide repeat protein [Phycisphaerales bacterium]|nr:MAG: tetratricopeptide repeat protein [Phycisphaerales bacterium]